jgi:siroheme synthase
MGLGRIQAIAQVLVDRGWLRATPAAVLLAASTIASDTWTCTLGDLARGLDLSSVDGAGTIVIGDVVKLRAALVPTAIEERARAN